MNLFLEDVSVRAEGSRFGGGSVGVHIFLKGGKEVATDVEFKANDPHCCINEPALFSLPPSAAQTLMDDLWAAGVRPTEGAGSAGAMAAVQKHLEDMRKIAFGEVAKAQEIPHSLRRDMEKIFRSDP
jgi:hypothetical protein